MNLMTGDIQNGLKIISLNHLVTADETAFPALVNQNIFPVFQFDVNGFHQTAALCGTISRIDVDMLRI